MKFYTKSYLSDLSESRRKGTKTFSSVINENKNRTHFDIFLSHSFKDQKYIAGLYLELTSKGYSVYVDWIIDPHFQRDNVTKATVDKIRLRMKQSKSLIYATSENASNSKWMPWELGFMDGDKGRCAILPITDYETDTFKGQEFLSAYPLVTKGSNTFFESDLNIQLSTYSSKEMKSWMSF
ncbi:toll/interleukin-1 receptor domain-containing protein [Yeosuana marina]|uniref:toll/interleukin-1 receptor domain-containing protein n=1 Tax=Yeosuana marina TaxID=1565536 RepID=UPI0030C7FF50